ncbi:MAG TPA: 16S rRNA (uracil(1498)-N(3))-methyltransferase [Anaeromyxobacteraceae bacterium]|nr:16S rRNA (uracil(1498)-N(3))-methyltransferase [Anaeromyxobacteraceae bacterium]
MSARRVHLPPERIAAGRARLTAEASHYLRSVLRLRPGDEVEVFDGAGAAWTAVLGEGEDLALGTRRHVSPPGARIWLAFALPKGEKGDLVVQKATELGAERFLPFAAERSVVRLDPRRAAERARRWRRIAAEAARQCGRADVPEVDAPAPLQAVLAAAPVGFRRLVLHGPGGERLAEVVDPGASGHLLVVGPEGGLVPAEVDSCLAAGARVASLGPRVLRAETAAIAAVALVQHRAGDG